MFRSDVVELYGLMKKCFKCGETKPLEMFYAHPQMPDGLLNKCRECAKADSLENYRRKIQLPAWKLSERQRNRLRIKAARAMGKFRTVEAKAKKQTMLRYKLKYPAKWVARTKVGWAMRKGELVMQPCEGCGAEKAQAHHDDYSKPLEVRWLCVQCHAAHHVALRERELLNQAEPVYYFRTATPVRMEHA